MSHPPASGTPWRRWGMLSLRLIILLVVTMGVGHRIWVEKEKIKTYDLDLAPVWLVVSGSCYLVGLSTAALFWGLAMRDWGGRLDWSRTLAAYYAGHLGKYVPGKGMVLVIRASMAQSPKLGIAPCAITCAQETILSMATGSLLATLLLPFIPIPHHEYWLMLSALLSGVFGLLALPPVISWLGRMVSLPFVGATLQNGRTCRWRTLGDGAVMIALGWFLMGLSLAALLAAMHSLGGLVDQFGWSRTFGLLTTLVALASVGGFVSLTPGGLGTREWILVETLSPVIGSTHGVIAAVLLRMVMIVAELLAAGILWVVVRLWSRQEVPTN